MGNPRGVRRDFEALEKRRREAVRLVVEEGWSQSAAARQVKAAQQSVSRWVGEYRRRGSAGLRRAGRAGRKPLLNAAQRERLTALLLEGPEAHGFPTPLWTCPRVVRLIGDEFGVDYHEGHVWKVLRGLGWSPQRPVGQARERNEEAIRTWKRTTWPGLKKSPRRRPHHSLHRRKRIESEAAPLPQLGAAREDAHPTVQLQLAEAFRRSGADAAQLLFPALSRRDPTSRGDRLSQSARASHRETAADRLGSIASPPQPLGAGVHRTLRRAHRDGVLAGLCPGTESGGIHLVVLEAARTAECLSQRLRAAEPARPPSAAPHATQTTLGHGPSGSNLLFASINSILCETQ